jgi:hypothetical protein
MIQHNAAGSISIGNNIIGNHRVLGRLAAALGLGASYDTV